MIYKQTRSRTIQQGDIFFDLPFTDLDSLSELSISTDINGLPETKSWNEVKNEENIFLTVKALPTAGIVISQDCDNVRKSYISFAKIDSLVVVLNKENLPTNPKELLALMIKESARRGYSFYYLPQGIGFNVKMAADLKTIFQLPRRSLLEMMGDLRKGTLKKEPLEHFRQTLSSYFTRYAYSEWYPLDAAEYELYYSGLPESEKRNVTQYPHQIIRTESSR